MKKFLLPVAFVSVMFVGCPINIPNPFPSPSPTTTPTPAPTPLPTPVPTPTPGPTCKIPDVGATPVSPRPAAQFTSVLNTTLQELYGGEPQSRVVINETLDVSLNRVVNALKAKGICAGIQAGADEVCILEADGSCQGYHVFVGGQSPDKGTVGWAPGNVRDTWVLPVGTPTPLPTPVPTPTPVASGCPAGTPPVNKYVVDCRPKAGPFNDFCSATPKVHDTTYCAPNADCPYAGGEGSPLRLACEKALASPVVWTGGTVRENNFLSADVPKGNTAVITGPGGATGTAKAQ